MLGKWMAGLASALALNLCALTQEPPPVFLNHLSISVSEETFHAIANTQFLAEEFSGFEERTTVVNGGREQYNGLYLYGEKTYVEFVEPSAEAPPGTIGFGMSIDDRGRLPELRSRLEEGLGATVRLERRTRSVEGKDVPWFDAISAEWVPHSRFDLWVMAYYPEYFVEMDHTLSMQDVQTTREQYLYFLYETRHWMNDIRRVTMWQEAEEIQTISKLLVALGYQLSFDGVVRNLRAQGMEFVLVPLKAEEKSKVEIDFTLNRKYDGLISYRFPDDSTLVFFSRMARWSFPGPVKTASRTDKLPRVKPSKPENE